MAKGSTAALAITVTSAGVSFVSKVVLARFLGAAHFGEYVLAITWVSMATILTKAGFDTASVRFFAEYSVSESWSELRGFSHLSTAITLGISAVVAAALILGRDSILPGATATQTTALLLAGFTLPLLTQLDLIEDRLRGLKHVVKAKVPKRLIARGAVLIGVPLLAWTTDVPLTSITGVTLFAVGTVFALAIAFGFQWRALPTEYHTAEPARRHSDWLRVSLPLWLMSGAFIILNQTDIVILGWFVAPNQIAIYEVAFRIAAVLTLVVTSVNYILAPITAELYSSDQYVDLQRIVSLGVTAASILSIVAAALVVLFRIPILRIFGHEFASGSGLLLVLIGAQLAIVVTGPVTLLLNMTGHERDAALILGGAALLNGALNFYFIPRYGVIGAAYSTLISTVIWTSTMAAAVWKRTGIVPLPRFRLVGPTVERE